MRYMNRKSINFESIIKIISMMGFALLFYTVIESGNVQYYVHPRMIPYMKFGILGFILISFFMTGEIYKAPRKKIKVIKYLIFIIPLILAFSMPPKTMNAESLSINSNSGQKKTDYTVQEYGVSQGSQIDKENSVDNIDPNVDIVNLADNNNLLKMQGDTIIMDENSFIPWIQELYINPEKYLGKRIEVVGFVFRVEQFNQNEFVPARNMISCCAADMEPVGLLCNYQNASELKTDAWVKVVGKIQLGEFGEEEIPIIVTEAVEQVEKPENEIVYP